jgi:hypothetical protein
MKNHCVRASSWHKLPATRIRAAFVAAIATIGTVVLMASGPATASADYWRKCGSQPGGGAGWYHARAHNLGCGKARTVAQRWTDQVLAGNRSPEPLGFTCNDSRTGYEVSQVTCRREVDGTVQKVRFEFGA